MDEGAFILDYIMPAGSSLADDHRRCSTMSSRSCTKRLRWMITTRRTGLQLGLAAVTEANYRRHLRAAESEALARRSTRSSRTFATRSRKKSPTLDVEFVQVLEDMINDLSNSPEPIQIKLFSTDTALLHDLGPKVQAAIATIPGVVDTQNGMDNTLSGPATTFQVDPAVASRLGFTVQEIAEDATSLLDGLPTTDPVIVDGRPYTVRVRMSDEHRASLDAIKNTVFNSATGHTATLGALAQITGAPAAERDPPREPAAGRAGQRQAGRLGPGRRDGAGEGRGRQAAPAGERARGVRRHLPGAAEVLPRSGAGAGAGAGAGLRRAAGGVPQLLRAHRDPDEFRAVDGGRGVCAADHATQTSTWPASWG